MHLPQLLNHQPDGPRSARRPQSLKSLAVASMIALCAATTAGADRLPTKELAGPAEDFTWMRLPEPSTLAVSSKRTLIPIDLSGSDADWRREITVDPGSTFRLIVLQPEGTDWRLDLQTPDGLWLGEQDATTAWESTAVEDLGLAFPSKGLSSKGLPAGGLAAKILSVAASDVAKHSQGGVWVLSIKKPEASKKNAGPISNKGLVIVQNEGPWSLKLWSNSFETVMGRPLSIEAVMGIDLEAKAQGSMDLFAEQLELSVSAPDGSERRWNQSQGSLDQILQEPAEKESGLDRLRFQIMPSGPGLHRVSLRFQGRDGQGSPVERTAELAVHVVEPPFGLADSGLTKGLTTIALRQAEPNPRKVDDGVERLQINLPVVLAQEKAKTASELRAQVYTELWGHSANGLLMPIAWIGGMKSVVSSADGSFLPLRFDARWLARVGAHPPYTLKNLRLVDPDSAVPFANADTLSLESAAPDRLLSYSKAQAIEPDEAMLQGPRPVDFAEPPTSSTAKGSVPQETIVLVHGYCSGNLWYAPRNQFPEPRLIFRDFGEARSNDQFAQEILNQTNGITHFSTVSHSQGGMASLHLYNYYWSGLDNSDAPRPLQSVGTPFLGSSLMMNQIVLQPIINLLGIRGLCRSVVNLTNAGAALWLSNIPSSSRDKAYYYRTRGRDFVPCFWSSPVIPGRDDGVVSTFEGILPGGHNLGVTSRQCHTSGMSHPFQLLDVNRNNTMAANARIWISIPDPIEACANVTPTRPYAPALTVLNASCSTVQSGTITQYNWQITGAVNRTLTGRNITTTLPNGGAYQIQLTIHSTNPTLTDSTTSFVYLSSGPNDPL